MADNKSLGTENYATTNHNNVAAHALHIKTEGKDAADGVITRNDAADMMPELEQEPLCLLKEEPMDYDDDDHDPLLLTSANDPAQRLVGHFMYHDDATELPGNRKYKPNTTPTGEEKTYDCDQCSYVTNRNSSLKRHKEAMHEGVNYPCDQCPYVASVKGRDIYFPTLHISSSRLFFVTMTKKMKRLGVFYFYSYTNKLYKSGAYRGV